jgi:hypothetical protein
MHPDFPELSELKRAVRTDSGQINRVRQSFQTKSKSRNDTVVTTTM